MIAEVLALTGAGLILRKITTTKPSVVDYDYDGDEIRQYQENSKGDWVEVAGQYSAFEPAIKPEVIEETKAIKLSDTMDSAIIDVEIEEAEIVVTEKQAGEMLIRGLPW